MTYDTRTSPEQKTVYLFSGLIVCGDCGQNMVRRRVTKKGKQYNYYHCSTYKNGDGCSSHLISTDKIEEIVLSSIRAQIDLVLRADEIVKNMDHISENQPYIKTLQKQISQLDVEIERYQKMKTQVYTHMLDSGSHTMLPMERNISRLTGKIKDIEGRMMKAYSDYAQDLLDEETYQIIKKNLADEKAEVTAKREEYNNRLMMAQRSVQRFHDMAVHLAAYENLHEFDEKLTKELVSRIIVGKDSRVELIFNCMDVFEDPLINEYAGIIPGRS